MRWMAVCGLCLVAGLSACSTAGYRAPVAQFNEAAGIVVETSRVYIVQVNKVERDKYIDERLAGRQSIELKEIQARVLLTPEEIEIRLEALDQLVRYGNLLLKLANSDAPEAIAQSADGLGKAVEHLSATVNTGLGRPENAGFKGAVGPVTAIIGEVVRLATERKIQQALDTAVKSGDKPLKDLLDVLSEETAAAYERKRNYLSRARTWAVDVYNEELQKGDRASREALKQYAGQIKTQLDAWDAFAGAKPQEGLAALAEAQNALVVYAKSPKTPKNLGEFVSEMDRFLTRAKGVQQAVRKLSETQRESL